MKLPLLVFLFLSFSAPAQETADRDFHPYLYSGADAGYGFPALKKAFEPRIDMDTTYTGHHYANNGSFGAGWNEGFYLGCMIHPDFGLEAGVSFVQTMPVEIHSTFPAVSAVTRYSSASTRFYLGGKMSYSKPRYSPYIRMAFLAGLQSAKYYLHNNYTAGGDDEIAISYGESWSCGMRSSVGVNWKLCKNFSFFSEFMLGALNWAPERSTTTTDIYRGIDQLQGASYASSHTIYLKEFQFDVNNPQPDPNAPAKALKFYFPFSAWGFNAGFHYTFNYKTKTGTH